MKTQTRTLIIFNALALIAVLTMNYLANALPLNGRNTGQISDAYPNLFAPAGITFAIWGVIYLLLILWIGYQVIGLFNAKIRAKIEPHIQEVGWLFVLSCLLNCVWLITWHWDILWLSVPVMLGILAAILAINQKIHSGVSKRIAYEKCLGHNTFSIYQGWITVATIANITTLLVSLGWSGAPLNAEAWTILMILTGGALAIFMVRGRNLLFHGAAVAWAFFGIYMKRSALADTQNIPIIAMGMMGLILIVMALQFRKWQAV